MKWEKSFKRFTRFNLKLIIHKWSRYQLELFFNLEIPNKEQANTFYLH